jgi:hypothetical protein
MFVVRRIFLDTEFTDLPWSGHSELLWVGLADQDGNSWSAVSADVSTETDLSDFVRDVVVPLIPADEPRLGPREMSSAIVEFCAGVDEFWAWCPTPETLSEVFALGEEAASAYDRYWDWDFQLLKSAVDPWPDVWPPGLNDLHRVVRERRIEVPPNEHAHHPRSDALWDLHVWGLLDRTSLGG